MCLAQEAAVPSIARLELPDELPGVAALAFVPGGNRLLAATNDARVLIIDPESSQVNACKRLQSCCFLEPFLWSPSMESLYVAAITM